MDYNETARRRAAHAYPAYAQPPTGSGVLIRQISSLVLMLLLYSAALPYNPTEWVLGSDGGDEGYLIDRLCAGVILISACYFQWRIASLRTPLAVGIPGTDNFLFAWSPALYWPVALGQAALLYVAAFGSNEMLRRMIVSAVLGCLWVVGLAATPEETRRWAWSMIKEMWFWMIFDEVLGRRRRRR
jgi:hypothetical protein